MVCGTAPVWIERHGRLEATDVAFAGEAELRHAIERILAPLGGASTRPSRCATRGCPTARASTSSSRRWRSTARA
jgi:hypothetical protein